MPTYTQSWSPVTDGILSFTNIELVEVDVGITVPFVDTASQPIALSGAENGMQWGGFGALTFGAGSSQTLTFDYDVTSSSGTDFISSIDSLYVIDLLLGESANLIATANVYDLDGNLIGSQVYTHGGPAAPAVSFVQAQSAVHVTLTISSFIDVTDTTNSAIDLSVIQQSFGTTNVDQLCSIGDYVWLDLDGDGLQTAPSADPGLPTVTVQLMDGDGTSVLATTVTDNDGFYLFDNLQAGTYSIRFVTVDGFVFSPQDVGSDDTIDSDADPLTGLTGPITLEAGDHVRELDVGLTADGSGAGSTASLGDTVWVDSDGNGQFDNGEAGLEGVTVNLLDSTGTTIVDTRVTDGSGQYAFTNLAAGTYVVQFVGPGGYVFTAADQGIDTSDSDANAGTGLTGQITLSAGEVNATVDAGLKVATGSIGNYVWADTNGNGVQDGTESGLAGVTVNLLDDQGSVIDTAVTDGTGGYLFSDLNAGNYQIEFEALNNYAFTSADAGGNDLSDSDANTGTGLTGIINLSAGEIDTSIDAGLVYCPPTNASIGNYVWYDCDNDGKQDYGENGIGGVTVQLMNASGTSVLATTTTNSSGYYNFSNLAAGTYQVYFGTKSGYNLTAANQGTDDSKDSDANTSTRLSGPIDLSAGEVETTIDAGMTYSCYPTTGSIGNFVWYDCDKDGKQDYGENGLGGVTVKLMNEAGTSVLATTTTSSSGYYNFSGLSAGTYQVWFGEKSGYVLSAANQGTDDWKDSDANTSTRLSGPISLSAGENDVSVDAGFQVYCPPPTGSIGNYVWYDCDKDGKQDYGENGLGGVTVKLMNEAGTSVLATTTTSSSGYYNFSGLTAGTYQVWFGEKSGYVLSAANQGSDDWKDSDANTSTRLSGPIHLSAGENDSSVDSGFQVYCPPPAATGSIGNTVWCDTDKDGKQDYSEGGIGGVTVKLMNSSGTSVLATTTTNSSGHYNFSGLAAGTYQVYFGTKSGYTLSSANQGSDDSKDSDASTSSRLSGAISLSAGENETSVDAGMYASSGGGNCGPSGGGGDCDDDNNCGPSGGGSDCDDDDNSCDDSNDCDDNDDRINGLSAGFWSTHLKAWDGASDTTYANLVKDGTLSSTDVLRALSNQGKCGPSSSTGVLLGDSNGNGVKDGGENTLFVSLSAAQKIISSSDSAGDARQILMKQAIAAQLNIYNGDDAPGKLTVGADLISKAVQWLKGDGVFVYSDGSSGDVDRVGSAGVLESGSSGTIDFNTSSGAFTSSALSTSKKAWYEDKSMGISDFTADAEELKNALQAFNEDKLITSSDGTKVGWSTGGSMVNNDANGLWSVLRSHGVI